ncbi:MAG: hypothetical protein ACOYYS_11385 [Chloroflexota bacterium]
MSKQRLNILIPFFFFAFLCASLSIPAGQSLASVSDDGLAQATVTLMPATPYSTTSFVRLTPTVSSNTSAFSQEWQIMVHKIEQAWQNGDLNVDEAARLRFIALHDPENLPAAYWPSAEERINVASSLPQQYHDGESMLADRMMAVFYDQEQWSDETRAYIDAEMTAAPRQERLYRSETIHSTTHFDIYYDSDPASPDYPGIAWSASGSMCWPEIISKFAARMYPLQVYPCQERFGLVKMMLCGL